MEDSIDELTATINELIDAIDDLTESMSRGGGGKDGEKKEGGGGGGITEKISGAVGAITGVSSELLKLMGVISVMVAAISPSTFQAFQQAMLDLTATVGSGFVPVLQIATSAIREVSGVILPVIQQLQPLFTELANAIASRVVVGFRLLATIIETLNPLLQWITHAISLYLDVQTQLIQVAIVVIRTLSSFLTGIGGGAEFFKQLGDIIKVVIREFVVFAAFLAHMAGFSEFVGRLQENFTKLADEEEKRASGLVAAARNPAIEGIDSIGKKFQSAALVAAGEGGAREKTDTDFLREISKGIGDMSKVSPEDWQKRIEAAILKAGKELIEEIVKQLGLGKTITDGKKAIETVTDTSATSGGRFRAGRAAGGLLGGVGATGAGLASDAWDALPDVW